MQIVTWSDWLDRHIPYYEKTKQIQRYMADPPACVLVVTPVDRNRLVGVKGLTNWEFMDQTIQCFDFKTEAVFLDTDTHQRWYWAFWSADEALVAVIKLS